MDDVCVCVYSRCTDHQERGTEVKALEENTQDSAPVREGERLPIKVCSGSCIRTYGTERLCY